MTDLAPLDIVATDADALATAPGVIAVIVPEDGKVGGTARRVGRLSKGALARMIEGEAWEKAKAGDVSLLGHPVGMEAAAVAVLKLDRRADAATARRAGAALAKAAGTKPVTLVADAHPAAAHVAQGVLLRRYDFADHKTGDRDAAGGLTVMAKDADAMRAALDPLVAQAEGVFTARDLVNEPSNVLTTTEFAARIEGMRDLGLTVEVLDEGDLERLGMRTLLAVGQGSESPSKVVVMHHEGAGGAPLALIGKGVVFDTGGISLKPAGGMEDMTMDMGGAGTVVGVMETLARRKAPANVVGLVGLVENMPDGRAQRPGDVVASMKGDTVEVINTDAEGRLVLCDVMWYAQERFEPAAMIDLATLTGAIIIGLGHENAGVFSNDDALCDAFLAAARAEDEGAWRMPLGAAYDKQLKSRVADMKNVGGRPAGSITAAQFLLRFVKDGVPWIHLDIAGTASVKGGTDLAPGGATGWGVRALDRLVRDRFETRGDA